MCLKWCYISLQRKRKCVAHTGTRMRTHGHAKAIACIERTTDPDVPLSLQVYLDRVYDFNNMFDWAAVVWDDWDLAPGFKGASEAIKLSSSMCRAFIHRIRWGRRNLYVRTDSISWYTACHLGPHICESFGC